METAFDDYWKRMQFREEFRHINTIPVKRWYVSDGLNEIDQVYFNEMKELKCLLEIGSGTNSLQKKFRDNGYGGLYHTMDLSREFIHDYYDLNAIDSLYDGILILEVIEHMSLEHFWSLLDFIDSHIAPQGKLIISTSHPGSIVPWQSWDMTHIQHYPLHDLYALFRSRGFSAKCYRVWCQKAQRTITQRVRLWLRRKLCYILGLDYADSIALILQKQGDAEEPAKRSRPTKNSRSDCATETPQLSALTAERNYPTV